MKYSWKKTVISFFISVILVGMGFAVRYGEDNQVGSSNNISLWIFFISGVFGYYSFLTATIMLWRKIKGATKKEKSAISAKGDI
jgi:hypothetical protein